MEQFYPNMTTTMPLVGDTSSNYWRPTTVYQPLQNGTELDIQYLPDSILGTTVETKEYTGGSVSYYKVDINNPTSNGVAYVAECNDIIEALGMNYAEGNAFKAIWRSCAARNLGLSKDGYKDGVYDAEKVVFFGTRMVEQAKNV